MSYITLISLTGLLSCWVSVKSRSPYSCRRTVTRKWARTCGRR